MFPASHCRNNCKRSNAAEWLNRLEEARAATVQGFGKYMALTPGDQYNLFGEIMKLSLFEKKFIRKSYLQELLLYIEYDYLAATAVRTPPAG